MATPEFGSVRQQLTPGPQFMDCSVSLVTGASSGFGKAAAQHVLKNGDIAVVTARKREALDFCALSIPATNCRRLR